MKSLPGAYLYIPLLASAAGAGAGGEGGGGRIHHHSDAIGAGAGSVVSVSSLASVRRSLSDPEIHFAPPFGHPVILTVNPSSDNIGDFDHLKYSDSKLRANFKYLTLPHFRQQFYGANAWSAAA